LGQSHTLKGRLDAAERLKDRKDIGFLIVGAGARWNALHDDVVFRDLDNVRLLPFQPEALLPQTLAAGDIAVVSMEPGSAGYMVPSKTYYYLAAGSALLALVPRGCEVADLVERSHCGLRVDAHLVDDIVRAIEFLGSNRQRLEAYRRRGLEESRRNYSRANIRTYIETVRPLLLKSP
jgi:glycosyltransferase involved in cell wall biosynthesis